MWSDNETTEDLLGFQVHADLIRSIVTDSEMLPVTIGIFGDWGSGKTSVMRMLEKSFDPNNYEQNSEEPEKYEKIACLYFNGWLFEGYDDAKSAIISSILLQLSEHKRFGPRIREKVTNLLKSVDGMRLARYGLKSGLPTLAALLFGVDPTTIGLTSMASAFTEREKESEDPVPNTDEAEESKEESKSNLQKPIKTGKTSSVHLEVRSFRSQFSELIAQCEIDSLVVLIDDLDRCSPERIIDNLEAIKLFLNVEHTAFVIGADPRIVRHAIATRYKPDEIQEQDNQEEFAHRIVIDYLEKLIQIPYHLPRLSPTEVETYMVLLFCLRDLEKAEAEKCLAAFNSFRANNRYSVFGYTNVTNALGTREIPDSLSKSLTFSAASALLITEGLKGNPRQVKRFLNAFVLRKQLAEVAKLTHVRDEVLVKLMVLEYGHLEQYQQLYKWQAAAEGFPKEIQILESNIPQFDEDMDNGKSNILRSDEDMNSQEDINKKPEPEKTISGWEEPFLKRWIKMKPLLSEVDLRDYFWISRDRIQSTLSGISMVSPIVRRLFEDLISGNKGKRNRAVKETIALDENERISLLILFEKHVPRHPKEKKGYDALHALIEKDVDGAPETLVRVLDKCPVESMPPAIGVTLKMLANSKLGLKEILHPVINRLEATNSRIGRALKKRNLEN